MKERQFAVIGLGVFGSNVAKVLAQHGAQVLAIDREDRRVNEMAAIVTQAVVADATDASALRSLGLADVDVAIVSIGENLEASILVTLLLQELGVKSIVVKALSEVHARVLAKVGADRVVFPERDMAEKIVESLVSPNILDEIQVSQNYNLIELVVPPSFVGETLNQLGPRERFRITVVAIRRKVPYVTEEGETDFREETIISPDATEEISEGDVLVIIGRNDDLDRLKELKELKELKD